jgi:hypothetical protein
LKTITPRTFDSDELAVLTTFAHQAAIAIENARLYSALESRVRRLDTLTGLNRLISDSLEADHILKQIANSAAALMDAGFVIVWSADEGRREIQARAVSDAPTLTPYPHPVRKFGGGGVMGSPKTGARCRLRTSPPTREWGATSGTRPTVSGAARRCRSFVAVSCLAG